MSKYRLTKELREGFGGTPYAVQSVVELPDGKEPPPGAERVPPNTHLHEWRRVEEGAAPEETPSE